MPNRAVSYVIHSVQINDVKHHYLLNAVRFCGLSNAKSVSQLKDRKSEREFTLGSS